MEQRKKLIVLDPGLAESMGDIIEQRNLFRQPVVKWCSLLCPGGQGHHDRERLSDILLCVIDQMAGQIKQQGRFACAWLPKDEQFLPGILIHLPNRRASRPRQFWWLSPPTT